MKAIKDNKVYTVDETSKKDYLARGYDIYEDDGELIERSPQGTVSRREYDELLAKYEALRTSVGDGATDVPTDEDKGKKKGKSGGEPDVSGTE